MKTILIFLFFLICCLSYVKTQPRGENKDAIYVNQNIQNLVKRNKQIFFNREVYPDNEIAENKMVLPIKGLTIKTNKNKYLIRLIITDEIYEEYLLLKTNSIASDNSYFFDVKSTALSLLRKNSLMIDIGNKKSIRYLVELNDNNTISVSIKDNPILGQNIFVLPIGIYRNNLRTDYLDYIALSSKYEKLNGVNVCFDENGAIVGLDTILKYEILFKRKNKIDGNIYTLIDCYTLKGFNALYAIRFNNEYLEFYEIDVKISKPYKDTEVQKITFLTPLKLVFKLKKMPE